MRLLSILSSLAIVVAAGFAQEAAKPQTNAVHGVVVNQRDNTPVRKATVRLQALDNDEAEPLQTQNDAAGRFQFNNVPAGRYEIGAERQGFFQVMGSGRRAAMRITVGSGDPSEVKIKLAPAASIRGQITDEDGDPLGGIDVRAVTRNARTGKPQPGWQSVTTDERGEYRIHDLAPGKYLVTASPGFSALAEAAASDKKPAKMAVVTYYPGTVDEKAASEVAVGAGDETTANLTLLRASTVTVKGQVLFSSGKVPEQASVFAQAAGGGFGTPRAVGQAKKGEFELTLVSGRYQIVAMTASDDPLTEVMPQMTRQSVEVGPDGVRDLKLTIAVGGTKINGRVRVDGDAKVDFPKLYVFAIKKQEESEEGGFGGFMTSLRGGSRASAFALAAAEGRGIARPKPDGSFEIPDLPPGDYDVELGTQDKGLETWYLKSIVAGTHDVTDSGLKIADAGTVPLSLVLSPAGAQIEGVVLDADQHPVEDATVTTIPDPAHQWRNALYHTARTDSKGHFIMKGVEPGAYRIFAWDEIDEGAWRDEEYLKTINDEGTGIDVKQGERKDVRLKAIVAAH